MSMLLPTLAAPSTHKHLILILKRSFPVHLTKAAVLPALARRRCPAEPGTMCSWSFTSTSWCFIQMPRISSHTKMFRLDMDRIADRRLSIACAHRGTKCTHLMFATTAFLKFRTATSESLSGCCCPVLYQACQHIAKGLGAGRHC